MYPGSPSGGKRAISESSATRRIRQGPDSSVRAYSSKSALRSALMVPGGQTSQVRVMYRSGSARALTTSLRTWSNHSGAKASSRPMAFAFSRAASALKRCPGRRLVRMPRLRQATRWPRSVEPRVPWSWLPPLSASRHSPARPLVASRQGPSRPGSRTPPSRRPAIAPPPQSGLPPSARAGTIASRVPAGRQARALMDSPAWKHRRSSARSCAVG